MHASDGTVYHIYTYYIYGTSLSLIFKVELCFVILGISTTFWPNKKEYYFSSNPSSIALFNLRSLLGRLLLDSGSVLLDQGQQLWWDSADELVNLLAVPEQVEGGHGLDVGLLGQLGELIDVNLDEDDVRHLIGPPR